MSGIEDSEQERTEHGIRVSEVTERLARKLGLSEGDVHTLHQASLLRQIGIIAVSREILNKPGPLSEEERNLLELHPSVAEKMLDQLKFSPDVIDIVKHHHERYDGNGYPGKLAREDIPLMARILSVTEAFVAMRSELPYRPTISIEETINELKANSGGQFDPSVVESMVALIEEGAV
jgi:HD-GYP domain-containing protein (c-di-GMP phosphodiesterase class II)